MKRVTLNCLIFLFAVLPIVLSAQQTFPRNNVADQRDGLYAFTNATIHKSWNETLTNASLVIKKGKVEAVGQGIKIPAGAVIIDLKGKSIYPSFIEIYSNYGMPESKREGGSSSRSGTLFETNKDGAYGWNTALKPEFRAHQVFEADQKSANELRKNGFGSVLTHNMDGISRGSSALVTLSDERENEMIVKERVAHHFSFSKGNSPMPYPRSLMGCIYLIRQAYYDAEWYSKEGHREETNLSLAAWNELKDLQQIFDTGNKLEVLRAANLGREFGVTYLIKGDGDEYQRLEEIKATGSSLILPLNFPSAYDVEDPYDAVSIDLADMKHWELAPTNAAKVAGAGIPFALTQHGLSKGADFLANVRKAIEYGLSEKDALKALTYTPALFAKCNDELGSLDKGMLANFIITDGNVFEEKTKIYHNWVKGKPFVIKALDELSIQPGAYLLTVADMAQVLEVNEKSGSYEINIVTDDTVKTKVKNKIEGERITLSYKAAGSDNMTRLSGSVGTGKWIGSGQDGNGNWVSWACVRTGDLSDSAGKKEKREMIKRRISQVLMS